MGNPTPGPWVMGQTPYSYEEALVSASGAVVAYAAWDGGSGCHLSIENPSDAHLIAAAPELLEALRWAVDHFDGNTRCNAQQEQNCIEKCRAAIAKAKGEA